MTDQPDKSGNTDMIYVGIGSSAGGLEASRELVKHLPTSSRLTYIVAQHLSPSHTSMLVELIGRETRLSVSEITNGLPAQPGQIYITPPNKDLELEEGRLLLHEPRPGHAPKPNINRLFTSMARDQGAQVVGIILSGTGSDGALGIAEIKMSGGITIAQSPKTSKYDGMPRAAIQSEAVDLILAPKEIGEVLASFVNAEVSTESEHEDDEPSIYRKIVDLTHRTTGIDLANYRTTTILRRIRRRMAICQIDEMGAYLEHQLSDQDEVHAFARDAFISVTGFFRDAAAFAGLREIILSMLDKVPAKELIRIWVPGCASGEEAYSIAILMEEAIEQRGEPRVYRIFATDISHKPLITARQGVYDSEAVSELDPSLLEKYFVEVNGGHQIVTPIREHCVFSLHDISNDPPFSRIDLVTCRNLLIYFNNTLQRQVIETLHYALKPAGYLMLGKAENANASAPIFKLVNEVSHIYQRQEYPGYPRLMQGASSDAASNGHGLIQAGQKGRAEASIENQLHEHLANNSPLTAVLINDNNDMIHIHGDGSAYFSLQNGPCDLDVFSSIKEYLRPGLRALVHKARREGKAIQKTEESTLLNDGADQVVRVNVRPFNPKHPDWLVLTFEQSNRPSTLSAIKSLGSVEPSLDDEVFKEMEHELFSTRESLQTVVEELETTNEELQSTNEELQSANEEFISTNEELQTTNEELQSSNEELMTLNDELQEKTTSLQELNVHLKAIQDSLETPLLVVSDKLRLRQYGPSIDRIIPLEEVKDNDLVTALPWRSNIPNLENDLRHVIQNHQSITRLVNVEDRRYQLTAVPFRSGTHKEKGLVMAFTDTTELVTAKEAYRRDKDYLHMTLEAIADGVIRCDRQGRIDYLNPVAESILGVGAGEVQGEPLDAIMGILDPEKQDESTGENIALAAMKAGKCIYSAPEHRIRTRDKRTFYIQYSVAPILRDDEPMGAVVAFRDFTHQFQTLEQMKWRSSHDPLTGLANRAEMEIRLQRMVSKTQTNDDRRAALFYMDLDRFKEVNDSLGHLAGDELLRQITRLIGQDIRSRDTLARLGGDEFCVLLDDCNLKDAMHIAEKIRFTVNGHQFVWNNKVFSVGISIGIVMLGSVELSDTMSILHAGDSACQTAKHSGRNRIEIYSGGEEASIDQQQELEWATELTEALEKDRFRLYFQPVSDPHEDLIYNWEVLVRLFNHKGELLLPGTFLSPAERCGLISQIDIWTLKNALKLLNQYLPASSDVTHPVICLNLSTPTLKDPKYIDTLKQSLSIYDIEPRQICFEFKETVIMTHYSSALSFIKQIRDLGCIVGMDEYSGNIHSLSYLKELTIHYVKVGKAIISQSESQQIRDITLRYIHQVTNALNIRAIAKWVDDGSMIELLHKLGFTYYQGYAISKPLPSEEFLSLSCTA